MCRICAKLFRTKKVLYEHERRHEKQAPYLCCNKPFFSKANYTRHRCSNHGEQKKYKCSHCNAMFAIQADLNLHVRNLSMKDFHFKCDVCFALFDTKPKLLDHIGKHLPESVKRHVYVSQCQNSSNFERSKRKKTN